MNSERKIELLAPAGNLATAITAFDCGADAVYAGLDKFNARERTENFSFDEMSKLMAYAAKTNKKVYVTMNTLIKESELPQAAEYIARLAELKPDALIVQDIGVLRMVREYFPELTVHASTQMGIHNSAGLKNAERMGVERVILERQVTLDELEMMIKKTSLEIEVFVHGALCCSLSGQCLFSSWMGGWSGNRGKCKQPCRRRFFSRNGNGFFFSTSDLYMLEQIPALKELGVASLKIEGRLRKPDYVKNVVSAYRMVIDSEGQPSRETLGEARKLLSNSLGRKWSTGFSSLKAASELIQHDSMGVAGLLCGRVQEAGQYGFSMQVNRRLHIGDRIRIQPPSGDEGPAMTITKMSIGRKPVTKALSGQECFIFCDKEINGSGMVFKIGENYDDLSSRIEKMPLLRPAIDFDLKLDSNGITAEITNVPAKSWNYQENFAPAEKHALQPESVENEFRSGCPETMRPGKVHCLVTGNLFIPASSLKKIRRAFWEWVEANIDPQMLQTGGFEALGRFQHDYTTRQAVPSDTPQKEVVAVIPGGCEPSKRDGLLATSILDFSKRTDEVILPQFCQENRLAGLRKRVKMAYDTGIRRFRVTSLFGFELLRDYKEIEIIAAFPLPVCNSLAADELKAMRCTRIQAWLELEKTEIENLLKHSPLPVEVYRYGRPPLLATRATVSVEGDIKDIRENRFIVKKDKRAGITYVYPRPVMSIPRVPGAADFYDLTNAYWNEEENSAFNFDFGLI